MLDHGAVVGFEGNEHAGRHQDAADFSDGCGYIHPEERELAEDEIEGGVAEGKLFGGREDGRDGRAAFT